MSYQMWCHWESFAVSKYKNNVTEVLWHVHNSLLGGHLDQKILGRKQFKDFIGVEYKRTVILG